MAGITVAAAALPFALAFGVASSATAAAGLVTALVAASSSSVQWQQLGPLMGPAMSVALLGAVESLPCDAVLERLDHAQDIILSLRTVPLVDTTGVHMLSDVIDQLHAQGRRLYISGLARSVREKLERGGVIAKLGEDRIFWSADQAIIGADRCRAQQAESQAV